MWRHPAVDGTALRIVGGIGGSAGAARAGRLGLLRVQLAAVRFIHRCLRAERITGPALTGQVEIYCTLPAHLPRVCGIQSSGTMAPRSRGSCQEALEMGIRCTPCWSMVVRVLFQILYSFEYIF